MTRSHYRLNLDECRTAYRVEREMSVLVTGGAGYIGSVSVELLGERGVSAVVLDNLVHGHRAAIDDGVPFYAGNAGDSELIKQIVEKHSVDACIHFAAYAYVGESVTNPAKYFRNNTAQTISLLDSLVECGV